MMSVELTDGVVFAVLWAVSAWVRAHFHHHWPSAAAAGGIVMSIGIFTAFSFPQLPFAGPRVARWITFEILVIWAYLVVNYVKVAVNGRFRAYFGHPLRRFALGTWVAGTAVAATLCMQTLPDWPGVGRALAVMACLLYVPYIGIFVTGYVHLARHALTQSANGVILLATVSTQSIILALHAAFGTLPDAFVGSLMTFDLVFLLAGFGLILLHLRNRRSWLLAIEWKNANCIIHGAVSITGLTLVLVSRVPDADVFLVWKLAMVLFVAIEAVEFIRMVERGRHRTLHQGLLVYDVTQWTRNFTFGMLYAFSLSLYQHLAPTSPLADLFWYPLLRLIADYGQYPVLAILLVEISLFLHMRLKLFSYRARA